jgi:hypothetical protein
MHFHYFMRRYPKLKSDTLLQPKSACSLLTEKMRGIKLIRTAAKRHWPETSARQHSGEAKRQGEAAW